MFAGLYAVVFRFAFGLGASTNLTDMYPWGVWIGFKLFAVALSAGGFTIAAVVHIFNIRRYHPILRPMILSAFLGYSMFIISLLIDLGRPYRIWHPLVMWNPHSVMFEIAWCVSLYTTVLFLEFVPALFERLEWNKATAFLHRFLIPVVIAGVILSTLHQSSLGSLYLIVPEKLYPLWYSPLEPVFFFLSALCAGVAMAVFASWHSSRSLGKQFEFSLLVGLGRVLAVLLAVYLTVRALDIDHRGVFRALFLPRKETYFFWLEIALLIVPMILMFQRRFHTSPFWLYLSSVLTLFGLMVNRMNIAITGMEASAGVHYFPKWQELAITLGLIALAFSLFWLAVKYLPVYPASMDVESDPPPMSAAGMRHGEI
jgi:Ni/Fe-hydrogenase subunit HybB-like protein